MHILIIPNLSESLTPFTTYSLASPLPSFISILFCFVYLGIWAFLFWVEILYAPFMGSNIFGALQMSPVFIIRHQTLETCAFFRTIKIA